MNAKFVCTAILWERYGPDQKYIVMMRPVLPEVRSSVDVTPYSGWIQLEYPTRELADRFKVGKTYSVEFVPA